MKMNSSLLSRVGLLSTSAILLCGIQAAYGFESDSIISVPEAGTFFGGWKNKQNDALSRTRDALNTLRANSELSTFFENRNGNALALENIVSGDLVETTKVRHYYNGVEVIGSMAFHHRGRFGTSVRNAIRHFSLDATPVLSMEEAVSIARGTTGDRPLLSQPTLKILPMDEGAARLVYWVELNANGLDEARDVIIDAKSGEVLADLSKHIELAPIQIFDASKQGVELTLVPTPNGRSVQGCKLADLATGKVQNLTAKECEAFTGQGYCQVVLDGSPVLENPTSCKLVATNGVPSIGTDASGRRANDNSLKVLNYFQSRLGRNSYDGRGSTLISVVHGGKNYQNAHWDIQNNQMVYGDGDGKELGDFTLSLDVAGHEMAHGVTAHSAKLLGMGESGALNEAYSDFFGVMIAGAKDWAIGRTLFLNPAQAKGVRNLQDPHQLTFNKRSNAGKIVTLPYPASMMEKVPSPAKCDRTNDNCWVHVNATIPGHASYLVFQAVGQEKAEKLYYATLTQALTDKDTIASAALATKKMCRQMFDGLTCNKVDGAFKQVGL